jgi:hypothetical protein
VDYTGEIDERSGYLNGFFGRAGGGDVRKMPVGKVNESSGARKR